MSWAIKAGDARAVLAGEAAGSVQTVCTSPPYFGLRSYKTEGQIWGGVPGCDHIWGDEEWISRAAAGGERAYGSSDGKTGRGPAPVRPPHTSCLVLGCGAWRGELGGEPTVEAYVAHLVEVFRAVKRVLRSDGTCWVNLGDSYGSGEVGRHDSVQANHGRDWSGTRKGTVREQQTRVTGLPPKSLLMVPARFALAMQADGWILRQDIIWSKPNCMPESVTDRPTTAHEHVFLFAQQARYFYDADAIREPQSESTLERFADGQAPRKLGGPKYSNPDPGVRVASSGPDGILAAGRNARSVWSISSQPYSGAHFATFPPELPRRCIQAGSRPGDLVCDPFAGAGTTGMVALRLGRRFLGIELNPAYAALAAGRIQADCPLFNTPGEIAV